MGDIENKCVNTIRFLAVDAIQKANSGHPGMPMGCAPIAFMLYAKLMKHNPANSKWLNRDRFVLSAGHGSMLLYSILHLTGYNISLNDLMNFRQWKSKTPGHPEYGLTDGVETTTGPLGQGFSNAVGMAMVSKFLAGKFNKDNFDIINHYIYVIMGDGDMMEGISHEAASFAGHNKLSNLIVFYDDNHVTIDGDLSLAMSENVAQRFEAYGWQVLYVNDVNELEQIEDAVKKAQSEISKPSLIITKTTIGYGSPNKQGTSAAHGSPLGKEEVILTKRNLGWYEDKTFFVPEEVKQYFSSVKINGEKLESDWNNLFKKYSDAYPEEAALLKNMIDGNYGNQWKTVLPKFENYNESIATRKASGKVLAAIAPELPMLIGGSADLTPSNNTSFPGERNFSANNYSGRYFHFGIREHAMGGILNGMAYYGGVIPYGGTFLVFSDYMRPPMRIASFSHLRPIYVFTHDSIGLGEDGPTHQPVEHLMALRAIPKLILIRPADANETVEAWKVAIEHKGSPVAIILTRQNLPILDRNKFNSASNLSKGAYILNDFESEPDIILMASGSEASLCVEAAEKLKANNINARVVSFPSWELFEMQSDEYKQSVLPGEASARLSVEAGVRHGWERYVGFSGDSISIEKFGASAPYKKLFEEYGFTVENVVDRALKVIEKNK